MQNHCISFIEFIYIFLLVVTMRKRKILSPLLDPNIIFSGQGTVAWIMTEGQTVTHTTRGQKGQYIIGIHYVLGYGNSFLIIYRYRNVKAVCKVCIRDNRDSVNSYRRCYWKEKVLT